MSTMKCIFRKLNLRGSIRIQSGSSIVSIETGVLHLATQVDLYRELSGHYADSKRKETANRHLSRRISNHQLALRRHKINLAKLTCEMQMR
jgi:hypothetical protein